MCTNGQILKYMRIVEAPLLSEGRFVFVIFWNTRNELKKSLEYAIGRTTTSTPRIWSVFWSSHQRFFKQLW